MNSYSLGSKALSISMTMLLALSVAAATFSQPSFAAKVPGNENKLKLMTWNLYQGVDLRPLAAATSQTEYFTAIASAYNAFLATDFTSRADAIANEIGEAKPDLIGLQEAIIIRTQTPADGPATAATAVTADFIQILTDKLRSKGLHYSVASIQTGSDVEAPGLFATGLMDVRLTDREAILVKDGLKGFSISNAQGGQYVAMATLPSPFGPIGIPRSWVSVDVTFIDGSKARVISTHLDPLVPSVQVSQANELLAGPGATTIPVVLIGDFNSNADGSGTATYNNLVNGAGLKDAWNILGMGSGYTCCQDADLLNPTSALSRRIDLTLFKGSFKVQSIEVVGNSIADRTQSGLWPSDHAGVVTKLKLNSPK
jgi:endonuclease/exonuclease/phosphatase family metal-dependent hydrolase